MTCLRLKTTRVLTGLLITLFSSGILAQELSLVLPNNTQFFPGTSLLRSPYFMRLEAVPEKKAHSQFSISWPAEDADFASMRFSSARSLPEAETKGSLNIYFFPAHGFQREGSEFLVDASFHKKATDSEGYCEKEDSTDCTLKKHQLEQQLSLSNRPELPLEKPVYFSAFDNVSFSDINFEMPMIREREKHCRINWLRPSSSCSMAGIVLMQFTPEDKATPSVVVVHTVNWRKIAGQESIIAEAEEFLTDDIALDKIAKKFLAFKTVMLDDIEIKSSGLTYLYALFKFYVLKHVYYYSASSKNLFPNYSEIPEEPVSDWLLEGIALTFHDYHESRWKSGKTGGTIYSGDHANYDFLNRMHGYFSHDNAIQLDLTPGGTYFESSVVSMVHNLMGGEHVEEEGLGKPDGILTTGGSISIKVALQAYRDMAIARGIKNPEIIIPQSAHPAFKRGPVDLTVIEAPIKKEGPDATFTVDLEAMESLITEENTILLVGSAVNYPYGTVDPIDKIAEIAGRHNLDVHVDACMGGFVLGALDKEEHGFGAFDFELPQVSSISIDTHKYGYSLKGSSVLLLRDRDLSDYMGYVNVNWEGGVYAVASLGGSSSVGDMAAPFAAILRHGKAVYKERAQQLFALAGEMAEEVKKYEELEVMGKHSMCFAMRSSQPDFDIMHVKDVMAEQEAPWRFNSLKNPAGLHFCVTGPQLKAPGLIEDFRRDLAIAVETAKSRHKEGIASSGAGVYGTGAMGITLSEPENIEAFIRAGGQLLRGSIKEHPTQLLEDFKADFRRNLYKSLKMRMPRDRNFDPEDI